MLSFLMPVNHLVCFDGRGWPNWSERLEGALTWECGFDMNDDQEQAHARMRLAQLQQEHDDLHAAIDMMLAHNGDPLRIQRLKKKKLDLKDRLNKVASTIIPDIIA